MVQASYEYRIDLDGDLAFGSGDEDVTSYVKRTSWQLGAANPHDLVARAATLDMTLNNTDGRFSPEHGSGLSGFVPGTLVRVRTTYSATTRQHFIGWIDRDGISPTTGTKGRRETQVRASGWLIRIQDAEAFVDVQENKRTDEVVEQLVLAAGIYPPGIRGWLLGNPLYSKLGSTTILTDGTAGYLDLEEGYTKFNYAGDNWERGVSVYGALRDIVAAEGEGALLYVTRGGALRFLDRNWVYRDVVNAVDATLDGGDLLARGSNEYRYGQVINDVTVSFHPRAVGDSNEVLGTTNSRIRVEPGESATRRVQYDDGSSNRIGGKNVSITNLSATQDRDGHEGDLSGSIDTSIANGGNSAEVTVTNNHATATAYVSLSVQGIKITDYGAQEVLATDSDSIATYGRENEMRSMRMLDDDEVATILATDIIRRRKDPQGNLVSVTIMANTSDALMTHALARTMGDRVTISEAQTGVSSEDYIIVGEKHEVFAEREHLATWTLRPVPPGAPWLLGNATYGKLGNTTKLGV